MNLLLKWLRQPTTVAGLSAAFGTFTALLGHQVTWAQAIPLLAGAAVSIALPDNSIAKADAIALGQAIMTGLHGNDNARV
jgi:hypothetical protein